MSQSRITLSPQVTPLAEELLQLTGVVNLSNLFGLLLTRYGHHLKNSWVVIDGSTIKPTSMQTPTGHQLPQSSESQLEFTQIEDPVILRLARLVEEF